MSQQKLLIKVIQILNNLNIEYMLTGSIVSSLQGEPRLTHDIDIVVLIDENDINAILESFSNTDYYISKQGILSALNNNSMFNLIDPIEGDKVDFWIHKNDSFDKSRFSRKVEQNIMGTKIYISAPEDTILAKLRWLKLSNGSEKQFIDALRIYEVQYDNLDLQYIEQWSNKLKVEKYWTKIKKEATIL